MFMEASYWMGSWVVGLVALAMVQVSAVCADPTGEQKKTAIYYAPTMTLSLHQDLMGMYSVSKPNLRPVVAD